MTKRMKFYLDSLQMKKQSTLFVPKEIENKNYVETYNINYNYNNDVFYINNISNEYDEERYVFVDKEKNMLRYFMIDTDEIINHKESI